MMDMHRLISYFRPNPLKKIKKAYGVREIEGYVGDILQKLSTGSSAYGVQNILDPKARVEIDMRLGAFASGRKIYFVFYAKSADGNGEREFFYEPGTRRLIAGLINPSERAKKLRFDEVARGLAYGAHTRGFCLF